MAGRSLHSPFVLTDVCLLFALDLGHESADHLVVKVFFTQGVLSCRPDASNSILYSEDRHIKMATFQGKDQLISLASTFLPKPSGSGSRLPDDSEHETSDACWQGLWWREAGRH